MISCNNKEKKKRKKEKKRKKQRNIAEDIKVIEYPHI